MTQTSQRERQILEAKSLVKQKEELEANIRLNESILRSHGVDMKTPLVDNDGFPKAELDIYAIRTARSALVRYYNDLDRIIDEIQKALVLVHQSNHEVSEGEQSIQETHSYFAKVNGVAPDSPADACGLKRDDLIIDFGGITANNVQPLQEIAKLIPLNEFSTVKIKVLRSDQLLILNVIPKPWGGRGHVASCPKMFFGYEIEQTDENKDPKINENSNDANDSKEVNSWNWTGLMQSVKDTTTNMAQVVAKDLNELAEAGQGYAKLFVDENPSTSTNSKGNLFESALDALDDNLEKAEKIALSGFSNLGSFFNSSSKPIHSSKSTIHDRFQLQIVEAGLDPKTYLPIDEADTLQKERFDKFCLSFDQIGHAGKTARLVDEQPEILSLMKTLVPAKMTEQDFWTRYYFRVSELELEQQTRSLLITSKTPLIVQENEEVLWSSSDEDEISQSKENEETGQSKVVKEKQVSGNVAVVEEIESKQDPEVLGNVALEDIQSKDGNLKNASEKGTLEEDDKMAKSLTDETLPSKSISNSSFDFVEKEEEKSDFDWD